MIKLNPFKILLIVLFIAGLIYLILPGPTMISDIPALPNSLKSTEPGDTYQNPNNSAYFSNYFRKFVTGYYFNAFKSLSFGGLLPPIKLNHPPEEAFSYIRDQQTSTYLEEYLYPLRDSLFVNGYEPFNQNGKPFYKGITHILIGKTYYNTKTTLRIYHSQVISRVIVYILFWTILLAALKVWKKVLVES